MILAGYTGWDSGQLENEILSNYWFPVDINLNAISKISIKYRFNYALKNLELGCIIFLFIVEFIRIQKQFLV